MNSQSTLIKTVKSELSLHSHCLLKDFWSQKQTAQCRHYVETISSWTAGDCSHESWQETSGKIPADIMSGIPQDLVVGVCGQRVSNQVQWFNLYRNGQFIRGHRDAAGDLQMLFCIEAPPASEGGQLWLNKVSNVIEMHPGDLLLFKASKLLHGTNLIASHSQSRRLTLNVRLWLDCSQSETAGAIPPGTEAECRETVSRVKFSTREPDHPASPMPLGFNKQQIDIHYHG